MSSPICLRLTGYLFILQGAAACSASAPPALEASGTEERVSANGEPASSTPLDLAFDEISIFQALSVPLMRGGAVIEPDLPIVAGREALLRVFLKPGPAFTARPLKFTLRVERTSGPAALFETTRVVSTAGSASEDLGSTVNFVLPGNAVTEGARWSLVAVDPAAPTAKAAHYPASDAETAELGAQPGTDLDVVAVPIAYRAGGIVQLPDVHDADTIEPWRAKLRSVFPVRDVHVKFAEPLTWDQMLGRTDADGSWSRLIQAVIDRRSVDGASAKAFYVGVVQPTATGTFKQWCDGQCIDGQTNWYGPPALPQNTFRTSLVLGYARKSAPVTFAHEIAHAHRVKHSSCFFAEAMPSSIEAGYPTDAAHANGMLGRWGYDATNGLLVDPTTTSDFMGGCQNSTWVGDFMYRRLHTALSP